MSELFEQDLPPNWTITSLGEVAEVLDRFRIPINKDERAKRSGAIPYYGATGQVGWIDDYLFDQELILLGEDGAPFLDATKAKAYMVRGKSWVNNHAHVLVARKGVLNSFLLHQLNQIDYRPFVSGTTRLKLPQAQMLSIPIRMAPESEQERVVAEIEKHLTRLDAAISSLGHAQEALKSHRTAVLKAACEGRLVPTEAELARAEGRIYVTADDLLAKVDTSYYNTKDQELHQREAQSIESVTLPEGWVWATSGSLFTYITSGSRGWAQYYNNTGAKFLRVGNLSHSSISLDLSRIQHVQAPAGAEERRTKVSSGDILISITADIGMIALTAESLGDAYINQHICLARPHHLLNSRYLAWYLASPCVKEQFKVLQRGATKMGLGLDDVRALRIAIPPPSEQLRIVNELERRLSLTELVEITIYTNLRGRIGSLRRVVLKRAFEGGLVPQDPADESATILLERIRQSREAAVDSRPRRGRGIKPGVSTPGSATSTDPEPRRGAGNHPESASAPSGLRDGLDGGSLGLKPQALCPGPVGAEKDPAPDTGPDFLSRSRDKQIDAVWNALLGRGPLEKEEAVRTAAQSLRDQGLASFQRLRQGGPLWEAIGGAIDRGVRDGSFDRPRRGYVRALLPDARDYSPEIWRLCLLASLDHEAIEEQEGLRAAAELARESHGLKFERLREDGVILRGLRAALDEAVRTGEVRRARGRVFKSPSGGV